jgi:hypothetical protein
LDGSVIAVISRPAATGTGQRGAQAGNTYAGIPRFFRFVTHGRGSVLDIW